MFRTIIPLRFWVYVIAIAGAWFVWGLGGAVVAIVILAMLANY